jgi:FkbM family methyltransferase
MPQYDRPPAFYGQYGEDRWIAANLKLPRPGTFVEVGGADGREGSNTLHFEECGWRGIVVEPDPRQREALARHRRCHVVHGAVDTVTGRRTFTLHDEPTWSGFRRTGGRTVDVPTFTLDDLLHAHAIERVDLLSIDTEGTELDVWLSRPKGLRPSVVVVEHDTAGLPSAEALLMRAFEVDGYRLAHRTQANLIFTPSPGSTP